jgi:uncharacterized protein
VDQRTPIVDMIVPVTPKGAVDDPQALPERVRTPSVLNPSTATELITRMDHYGIDQSIVPARRYGPIWGLSYESVRDFVAEYPTRLFATAGIDPLDRMPGVRRFEQAVTDYGFVGAHTYSSWSGVRADDRLYYPYYAKAEELGVPIQIECMTAAGKRSLPSLGHPRYLERVANDFPGLQIVATHTGYPWERELVAVAEFRPNMYIGCNCPPPRLWPPEILSFIKGTGYGSESLGAARDTGDLRTSDRCLFGSNYLSIDLDTALPAIEALGLPDNIRAALMGLNAARLYRLGPP